MNNLSEYIGKKFTVTRNEITRKVKIKQVLRDRIFLCGILKDGQEIYKECFFVEDILDAKDKKDTESKDETIKRNSKIAEEFLKGKSRKELAKEFKLSATTITGIVKEFSSKKRTFVSEVN